MENDKKLFTPHAWKGAWNRPMLIDERGLHPFTIARMTDHNVRGPDRTDLKDAPIDDVVDFKEFDDFNDPSGNSRAA